MRAHVASAAPRGGCAGACTGPSPAWPSQLRRQAAAARQHRPCAARAGGRETGPSGDPFDPTTRRALVEAGEVLAEAQELARQQTLADLVSSWAADAPPAPQAAVPAEPTAAGEQQQQQGQQQGQQQDQQQQQQQQPSSPAALEAFWCEQGLGQGQAARLVAELAADPQLAAASANTQLLSQKLASLARVLPGADVAQQVARVPELLTVPSSAAVQVLLALVDALPGCDVVDAVACQPRLLLLDPGQLPARLAAISAKLVALHPSHSEQVVAGLISENPELILRMPYYLRDDVRLLDDLPIELQNMMVLGGKGLGLLYRYWGERGGAAAPRRSHEARWDGGGGGGE